MHKKGASGDDGIWSSIQNLKQKLRLDQRELQDIKREMSRGRSTSIIKDKPHLRTEREDDKENQGTLANVSAFREEFRRSKPQQQRQQEADQRIIEIRKQQKAQLKELTDRHREELKLVKEVLQTTMQEGKRQLEKMTLQYEEIIREKDAHIQSLEETLAADVKEEQHTSCHFELEEIKAHYQQEIWRIKNSYETIINNLSEENQQLTAKRDIPQPSAAANNIDLTFKNVQMILKNSNHLEVPTRFQAKIVESHNTSMELMGDHLEKELAERESTKTSRISEPHENNVYRKFKDKFKFVKRQPSNSVNSSMRESVKSSMHQYRIDPPRNSEEQHSVEDYGRLNDLSRRCTLQEAWQSWIGSQITEEPWDDRQVVGEDHLMNTIRNIKASLPS